MDTCSSVPSPAAHSADVAMADSRRVHGLAALQRAFDEARFGAARTLNLRESLPTGAEAARRVESWLRQHQVQQSAVDRSARRNCAWRSGVPCRSSTEPPRSRMRLFHTSRLALYALLSLVLASSVRAQEHTPTPMPGFPLAAAERERALEADAIARPSASTARTHSKELSKETHVAGSLAQERTRDYVIQQMRAMV